MLGKIRINHILLVCLFTSVSFSVGAKECVVLLHGLARTSSSMKTVKVRLVKEGYHVVNQGYPSRSEKIEGLSMGYVPKGIKACEAYEKTHFVTHSMGGILLRYYFEREDLPENFGHIVMLAPPNKGSEVVDALKYTPGFGVWNGPAGYQLGTDAESIPSLLGPVDYSVGIVAGTKESRFLSRYINGPNDGKVSVESTKVEGMADHIVFHLNHTYIMNSSAVHDEVINFLRTGEFKHN